MQTLHDQFIRVSVLRRTNENPFPVIHGFLPVSNARNRSRDRIGVALGELGTAEQVVHLHKRFLPDDQLELSQCRHGKCAHLLSEGSRFATIYT